MWQLSFECRVWKKTQFFFCQSGWRKVNANKGTNTFRMIMWWGFSSGSWSNYSGHGPSKYLKLINRQNEISTVFKWAEKTLWENSMKIVLFVRSGSVLFHKALFTHIRCVSVLFLRWNDGCEAYTEKQTRQLKWEKKKNWRVEKKFVWILLFE